MRKPFGEVAAAWTTGALSDGQVADALECDVTLVDHILDFWARQTFTTLPDSAQRRHLPNACVRLAMAHALHTHGGLALSDAAAVAAGSWQVSTSVLRIVEFEPRIHHPVEKPYAMRGRDQPDPFMLFAPHATEAVPIEAVDEYLDIVDGRFVYWRKPTCDAYTLGCELHRLADVSRREDTPALQDEYLELLCRIREPADHVCEWIGTVAGGKFSAAPNRFAERAPSMRQGPDWRGALPVFAESYGTKVSVNVSLAARVMKRRALGLAVTDPAMRSSRVSVQGGTR